MTSKDYDEPWHETVVRVLKSNGVDLVTYIPDNVLRDLIQALHDDPYFTVICPAREEEAVAIVAGAHMAGRRGVVLMQTSGFATLPNALASMIVPFQIPLGALIPERVENLVPGCKNIGTTHISNGCYRLHPVEWSIGEAAGALCAHALTSHSTPRQIRNTPQQLADFQQKLTGQGIELEWSQLS